MVTDPTSFKIRAEDGRNIAGTDISMFIHDLPNGKDTGNFVTEDASGSTSQAANVAEALESGAKVLLIGDIKGVDKLIPVLDIKFEDCGVKYGWAGNQAVIAIDPKALKKEEDYNAFLEKLNALPVPEIIKKKPAAEPKDTAVKAGVAGGIAALFGVVAGIGAGLAMSMFSNKTAVKQQMLFYGVLNLYNNHLEEYMQA